MPDFFTITDDEQAAYDAKQLDDDWQAQEDQQSLDDLWRAQSDARAAFTGGEAQYQAAQPVIGPRTEDAVIGPRNRGTEPFGVIPEVQSWWANRGLESPSSRNPTPEPNLLDDVMGASAAVGRGLAGGLSRDVSGNIVPEHEPLEAAMGFIEDPSNLIGVPAKAANTARRLPEGVTLMGSGLGGLADDAGKVANDAVEKAVEALSKLKVPNAASAAAQLKRLEKAGFDVTEASGALDDLRGIVRKDYDDADDYLQDRTDAWDAFLDSVDSSEIAEVAEAGTKAASRVTPDRYPAENADWEEFAAGRSPQFDPPTRPPENPPTDQARQPEPPVDAPLSPLPRNTPGGQATDEEIDGLLDRLEKVQKRISRFEKLDPEGKHANAPILLRMKQELSDGTETIARLRASQIPEDVNGRVPPPKGVDERAAMLDRELAEAGPQAAPRASSISDEFGTPEQDIVPQPFDLSEGRVSRQFENIPEQGNVGQPIRTPLPYGDKVPEEILATPEPLQGNALELQGIPPAGPDAPRPKLPQVVRGEHVVPLDQPVGGPRVVEREAPDISLRGGEARRLLTEDEIAATRVAQDERELAQLGAVSAGNLSDTQRARYRELLTASKQRVQTAADQAEYDGLKSLPIGEMTSKQRDRYSALRAKFVSSDPPVIPPRGPGEPPATVPPGGSGDPLVDRVYRATNAAPKRDYSPVNLWHEFQRWITDENVEANAISKEVEAGRSALLGVRPGGYERARREFTPIIQAVGRDGEKHLNYDLGIRRDIEMRGVTGNAERKGIGGLSSIEDSQAAYEKFRQQLGPEELRRIEDAASMVYAADRRLLDEEVAAGLQSKEGAEWLKQNHPNYSRTIVTHYLNSPKASGGSGSQVISQLQSTIKRLTTEGTFSDTAPPLQAFLQGQIQGHVAIEKNLLARDIARDLGLVPRPYREGDLDKALVWWKNGKRVSGDLDNPDLAKTLNRLDPTQSSALEQVFLAMNQLTRDTAVTYNPLFIPVNGTADAIFRGFQEQLSPLLVIEANKQWRTKGPLAQFAAERGGMMSFSGGQFHGKSGFEMNPDFDWNELTHGHIKNFMKSIVSSYQEGPSMNLALMEKEIAKEGGVLLDTPAKVGKIAAAFGAPGDAVRGVGEIVEMQTRLAVFDKWLRNGFTVATGTKAKSVDELLEWAQQRGPDGALVNRDAVNLAVQHMRRGPDFSRFGKAMRTVNAVFPFSNAAVQGNLEMFRALKTNRQSQMIAGSLVFGGAALGWYNRQPEMEDRYDNIPDWEKKAGAVVLLPGAVRGEDGSWGFNGPKGWVRWNPHFLIPLRPLAMFTSLGDEIIKPFTAQPGEPTEIWDALGRILGAVNSVPTGDISGIPGAGPKTSSIQGAAAGLVLPAIPAPLRMFIEAKTNTNSFTGGPVNSPALMARYPNSPSRWIGPSTTELAKVLGDKANMSPQLIDFYIGRAANGLGRTASGGISTLMGQEVNSFGPNDPHVPVVGGLISGLYRTSGGEVLNTEYDKMDERLDQLRGQYKEIYDWMTDNGASVGLPPSEITIDFGGGDGFPARLTPAERAKYQEIKMREIKLAAIKYQDLLKPLPLPARIKNLKDIDNQGDSIARAEILRSLSNEEVMRRVEQRADEEINGIRPNDKVTQRDMRLLPVR